LLHGGLKNFAPKGLLDNGDVVWDAAVSKFLWPLGRDEYDREARRYSQEFVHQSHAIHDSLAAGATLELENGRRQHEVQND
jgi:hypothetical protein